MRTPMSNTDMRIEVYLLHEQILALENKLGCLQDKADGPYRNDLWMAFKNAESTTRCLGYVLEKLK